MKNKGSLTSFFFLIDFEGSQLEIKMVKRRRMTRFIGFIDLASSGPDGKPIKIDFQPADYTIRRRKNKMNQTSSFAYEKPSLSQPSPVEQLPTKQDVTETVFIQPDVDESDSPSVFQSRCDSIDFQDLFSEEFEDDFDTLLFANGLSYLSSQPEDQFSIYDEAIY